MRPSLWTLAALLLVLLAPSRALGQSNGDSTLTIAPDGVVSIHVVDCKVHVVGSARRDVKVTATSSDVRVTGDGSHVSITVRPGGTPSMDVAVPSGVHLEVRGVDGGITIHDVAGPVQAGTVDGNISVDGAGRDVEASSVSGNVDVAIKHGDVRASSVSGTVSIHLGAGGTAWAKTVSGPVTLGGAPLTRAEARTVSGTVDIDARPEGDGPFEVHTHSGNVHVVLPRTAPVTVDARTHHGQVDNPDAGAPAPGGAHTVLTVWTFGGDVHVERK
jgi:DUF4097 and DUF4098 domain-containing protein YvlB